MVPRALFIRAIIRTRCLHFPAVVPEQRQRACVVQKRTFRKFRRLFHRVNLNTVAKLEAYLHTRELLHERRSPQRRHLDREIVSRAPCAITFAIRVAMVPVRWRAPQSRHIMLAEGSASIFASRNETDRQQPEDYYPLNETE